MTLIMSAQKIWLALCVIFSILSSFSVHLAFADELGNSLQQRIGDYDIQINTVPNVPISGQETRINIKISTVSNNPIIDTPVAIRISDEKNEIIRTQPILLSSEHYSYKHIFNKAGVFLLSVDILDNPSVGDVNDSNEELTFDFPIRISEHVWAQLSSLTVAIGVSAAATTSVISLVLFKKFKKGNKVI
jgi:hypothetical protein